MNPVPAIPKKAKKTRLGRGVFIFSHDRDLRRYIFGMTSASTERSVHVVVTWIAINAGLKSDFDISSGVSPKAPRDLNKIITARMANCIHMAPT